MRSSERRQHFRDQALWDKLVKRAMGCDFSWKKSVAGYEAVYQELAGTEADRGRVGRELRGASVEHAFSPRLRRAREFRAPSPANKSRNLPSNSATENQRPESRSDAIKSCQSPKPRPMKLLDDA